MATRKITRREFIVGAAVGTAGAVTFGSGLARAAMMGGGGMMGSGSGTINPPPGGTLKEPPVLDGRAGVISLEACQAPVSINGTTAQLLTYNGIFPGPTITVARGDILRINFKNSLPMNGGTNILGHPRYHTNIHTHGLHVSPQGYADNVMRMFMPGESDYYEYNLTKQPGGTFNFYHPHVHGAVSEQYWGGMVGALIVADETNVLAGITTHTLILKDITISGGVPEPYTSTMEFMHGKEGNTVMVNGQVNPVLSVRPGEVRRLRLLNASNARFYNLSLEGHALQVIGTEGGLLDRPYPLSRILLSPGERLDILVKASATAGTYRLLSLPYARQGMMSSPTITLLTMKCEGAPVKDTIPSVINPGASRVVMNTAMLKKQSLTLSMGQGRGYINGISFQSMTSAAMIHSEVGTYEVWEIVNNSGMDHPFHQHVNPCQVLSITGGDAGYASFLTTAPAWKDVVIIPKWGKVTMLVPVMDYVGDTMFHCHIIEHEDIGMMGVWMIMPPKM
ncbi:multicopper oxidase family protein [Geobacter pickeringii]|uniref:Multicopper oxidase n=1 Tax=Geobacter pickeringii TaxID=345632 RepID=A0A0B5B8L1_9BACT|nr:multicopper oxidase family protein [Geobacter pickeringii]AJE02882.1 multicopper oxidase [Geobacter pickeringii]